MLAVRIFLAGMAGLLPALVSSQSIAQINGPAFLSPYQNRQVTNVTGLITAKASNGIFMRSTAPDNNPGTSESIFVFSSTIGNGRSVGDIVSLNGRVQEYRSDSSYLYLTEITSPTGLVFRSGGNPIKPVVLGQSTSGLIGSRDLNPPTELFTPLDNGDVFSTPNNQSLISRTNYTLKPSSFGIDFWESLSGELVTVRAATVLDIPNSFGDTWVAGNWPQSGTNSRGGLTISPRDGNPEALLIQTPLDGTSNPQMSKLGDSFGDVTGVITYAFGSYTLRPRTAVRVVSSRTPAQPPATRLTTTGNCRGITISDYNVENLSPGASNEQALATQIVQFLKSPDILALQEIQDNNGAIDNGVTNANETLNRLIDDIRSAGGPQYSFTQIDPENDSTGGQPGGNIRNAYLFNSANVRLVNPRPGTATQANAVQRGPGLKYNPGLIDPNNSAFNNTRRPLAAQWETVRGGNQFFTVNTHQTSKGGSTSLFGDPRPPVNLGLNQRDAEATVTGDFIKRITNMDPNANVIASGDWNEFLFVQPQTDFEQRSGLAALDSVVDTTPTERYTYLFAQNSQALIHNYLSPRVARNNPQLDRIHANTWATAAQRASDHDPDVVQANVCQR